MAEILVRKTFKYKLKPTLHQEQTMEFILRRCCELYNAALEERKEAWNKRRVSVTEYMQSAQLPDLKKVRPEYREIYAQVLQETLFRVERTFRRYFSRIKCGEKVGYPRYRGASRYNSFTYKQSGFSIDSGYLTLVKIGQIAVRWSRPIAGVVKTVTIKRETDGWYVYFACADVSSEPLPVAGKDIGIDLGIESFATLSDGTHIFNPGWYRKAEWAIKCTQRRVTRRKKGSSRRKKAVKLLAKAHQKVRRQRQDFHHKTALALVRANDVIYHEDLRVRNMVKNHHLAKSIQEVGWAGFLAILSFKAECAGRKVIAVNPAFTSQVCSGCGISVAKALSVRWHHCPECGTSLHRDHNAAKNIERLGQSLRGGAGLLASENRETA